MLGKLGLPEILIILAIALLISRWRKYKMDPQSMRYWELPPLDAEPQAVAAPPSKKPRRR